MKSGPNWIRPFVAGFAMVGVLIAGMPEMGSAQTDPTPPKQHKWKHDKLYRPGPPCPHGQRPCPPGTPGGTNPGGHEPGMNPDQALNCLFVAGMEPTSGYMWAVEGLRDSSFPTATPVPPPAQRAVFDALGCDGVPAGTALAQTLAGEGNQGALDASMSLVTALRGLTTRDGQLPAAVEAFNGFVDASTDDFLSDPPPEFLVIHSFMGALVQEALVPPWWRQ